MIPSTLRGLGVASMALLGASFVLAQQPDNTRVNKQDRDKTELTADQQKMNMPDTDLTRKIRRAIMDDKSLGTYAHNVKIISRNGMVTLKGPVRTEDERAAIEAKAVEIAGKEHVTNQLTIAPKKGETN
jgi:hyperosmotically inducible periplasmic protein